MQPQKLAPTTEVGCGLQKFNTFSEKKSNLPATSRKIGPVLISRDGGLEGG